MQVERLIPKISISVMLLICGCAHADLTVLKKVNQSEKIALIATGTYGVLGPLKTILRKNGWVLIVDSGAEKTLGKIGSETDLTTTHERHPFYRFRVFQRERDECSRYEIVLIDNRTGQEISFIKGVSDCADDDDLAAAIAEL